MSARNIVIVYKKELTEALRDRLTLDPKRVEAMAKGLEEIAELPDPVGKLDARWTRPNEAH